MNFLVFFAINLPLVIWASGIGTLYYSDQTSVTYQMFFLCYVLLWVMHYMSWQFLSSRARAVARSFDLTLRYRIVIVSLTLITFFAALTMGVKFFQLVPVHGADDARFIVRSLPGFGFASRVVYWWPIVLAPFVLLYQVQRKNRSGYVLILLLFFAALFSGSKAGIVWLSISFLASLHALNTSGYEVGKEKKIVFFILIFSLISMAGIWVLLSEDLVSALGGFLFRVTYGAVEGIEYVVLYYDSKGASFPYFTIQRPFEELATTFRLMEKTYLSGDTGVYLARYFDRVNDKASYTISVVGLAYLEGGLAGLFFLFTTLLVWVYLTFKFFNSSQVITRLICVSLFIVYSHWLDWGWMDGIIVFSIIYVLIALILLKFIPRFRFS